MRRALSWTSWFIGGAEGKQLLLPAATRGGSSKSQKTPSTSPQRQKPSELPRWRLLPLILQFFDRLKLFWMPAKHQPDFIYLRHVPLRKVHLFTLIQLLCLVLLWAIKVSPAAIVFPMMVRARPFRFAALWGGAAAPLASPHPPSSP